MIKIRNVCAAGCLLLPATGFALELGSGEDNYGKIDFLVKAMAIVTAEDNGYDPNDGKAYLLKAKYTTPKYNGFSGAAGLYLNGDLFGWTDFDTERVARGMFVDGDGDDIGQLGEIYARYDSDKFNAYGGRMMLDTPLTKTLYSTTPNFYTALGVGGKPMEKLELGLLQIFEMSYGARSMTDWGLIGEGTPTAGAAIRPDIIGQAEFHDIAKATLGNNAPDTDGITAVSASYSGFQNTKLNLWDYYVHDIANNFYFDVDAKIPVGGVKALLGFQYLNQSDVGDSLRGDLDYDMFGLKAGVGGKGWSVWGAFNSSSGDTYFLNGWGGDPAYTSTIFSRNAYRENVDAWGLGFKYQIMPGLVFVAKHSRYGESDTLGFGPSRVQAQDDADETDLILTWKPKQVKGLMLRTFYANRTSEYDGAGGVERTQSHWRVIAAYQF